MHDETKDSARDEPNAKKLALVIVERTSEQERTAIMTWLESLIVIAKGPGSKLTKARLSTILTLRSEVIWPTVKTLARETKRHAWDERKVSTRFAAAGALGGAIMFGSSGAGIAALGTAIGVPLWIVTGAGLGFAGALLEEIRSSLKQK